MIVARGYITLTNIQGSANLLDWQSQWKEGSLPAGWSINGVIAENSIVVNENPFAIKSVMWKCTPNSDGNAAGGFTTPAYALDDIHTYRFSVFARIGKAISLPKELLLGCYNVDNLAGGANVNPYFIVYGPNHTDWCLLVGHIHPSKADNNWQLSTSGVYDMGGKKIMGSRNDFKLRNPNIPVQFRAWLYNCTLPEESAYFYNPRLEVCDGNEPSIEQLLQVSTREEIDAVKVEYKSEIQKLDNKIAFSVSEVKTYTDDKATSEASKAVDSVRVGGRNYIIASKLYSYAPYNTTPAYADGIITTKFVGVNKTLTIGISDFTPKLNEIYTVSGIIKKNGNVLTNADWSDKRSNTYNKTITFKVDDSTGRFEITSEYNNPADGSRKWIFHTPLNVVANDVITIEFLKFESGNKATDWTPAPEDVETDAQAKANAAQAAAEAVAVAKAELAKTTAQAYADGKVTAEEQRAIADAQAKLNEAKVDAQAKANAAQNNAITALTKDFKYPVGRFLTTATKGLFLFATKIPEKRTNMVCVNFDGYLYGNATSFGIKLVFYTYSTGLSSYGYIVTGVDIIDRIRLGIKDGMVCIEMKFKQDVYYPGFIVDIAATMGSFPRSYAEWTFTPDNIATGDLIDDTYTNVVVVPRKESFAETQSKAQFQILSDKIESKVSTESFNALGMRVSSAESNITQQAAQIASKVSQSNFDALGNRVTAAESSITQMPHNIALAVSTSEEKIKTSLTLDSTGISLLGKKIALTGVVTFASFASDAQSKVNNAQSTANSAVSKADAAQSTANSAVSKADTAQSGLTTLLGKLGDLSYQDMVSLAKLDTTIIEGGHIKTNLIDANAIITNALLAEKIAATDITTSRLTVTNGAKIGEFSIENGNLVCSKKYEISPTKIMNINTDSIRFVEKRYTDNKLVRSVAVGTSTLSVTTGIKPLITIIDEEGDSANVGMYINVSNQNSITGGNVAIMAHGGAHWVQGAGDKWKMPGVLWAGRINANGGVQSHWGDGCRVSQASATAVGFYDIYHDLGHTDYYVMITSTPYTTNGDKWMFGMVINKYSNYFTVQILDANDGPRRCAFEIAIIGRNTI